MRDFSTVIKSALILTVALGTALYVWYQTCDDEEEKDEVNEKTEEVKQENETEAEKEPEKKEVVSNLPLEVMIRLFNQISDTMILIYQHLGMMAIDLTQKGESEEEVFKQISEKYKSTMAVVEKQTCEGQQITHDQYQKSFQYYAPQNIPSFKSACYPCRYLLSRIENTPIEDPELPKDLTPERTLILLQAIFELSKRCDERILAMLCNEMKMSENDVRDAIKKNEGLKEQVYDLVTDAYQGSRKKVLEEEGYEESHLIISILLNREKEEFSKQMEVLNAERSKSLANLGLV